MDLGIYFKPIEKIKFTKKTIGSVVDSFTTHFPDWESSDIVFFSVHESRGSSSINDNDIDHLSIRKSVIGNLKDEIAKTDVLIVSTGADKPTITEEHLVDGKEILILDLLNLLFRKAKIKKRKKCIC